MSNTWFLFFIRKQQNLKTALSSVTGILRPVESGGVGFLLRNSIDGGQVGTSSWPRRWSRLRSAWRRLSQLCLQTKSKSLSFRPGMITKCPTIAFNSARTAKNFTNSPCLHDRITLWVGKNKSILALGFKYCKKLKPNENWVVHPWKYFFLSKQL